MSSARHLLMWIGCAVVLFNAVCLAEENDQDRDDAERPGHIGPGRAKHLAYDFLTQGGASIGMTWEQFANAFKPKLSAEPDPKNGPEWIGSSADFGEWRVTQDSGFVARVIRMTPDDMYQVPTSDAQGRPLDAQAQLAEAQTAARITTQQAVNIAREYVRIRYPEFERRRIELVGDDWCKLVVNGGIAEYTVAFVERPRPGVFFTYPNVIQANVNPVTGVVYSYAASNVRLEVRDPAPISADRARALADASVGPAAAQADERTAPSLDMILSPDRTTARLIWRTSYHWPASASPKQIEGVLDVEVDATTGQVTSHP